MMKLGLLRDWRILLVIFAVGLAVLAIHPNMQEGVVVTSIDASSPFYGKVVLGESIDWANEVTIESVSDLAAFDDFTGVFRFMHSGKLDLVNINTPGLGIIVEQKPSTNLKFGMDMVGGTRVLLQPETNVSSEVIQQTLSTLETRINTYGLKEAKFQEVKDVSGNRYIQIEMAGGSKQEVDDLLAKQGNFEGKIPIVVKMYDGVGELNLGDITYNVYNKTEAYPEGSKDKVVIKASGEDAEVEMLCNGVVHSTLNGMAFQCSNKTDESVLLIATILSGTDVTSVCLQDNPGMCRSTLMESSNGWEFMFQIFITQESAQKFATVTKNMKTLVDPNSGESYLESRIYFFLDDVEITSLGISSNLKGLAYTQPMITGGRDAKDDAVSEKLKLQSILQSGALPVKLKVVKVDQISPSLGSAFMKGAMLTIILAVAAVAGIMFVRYRKIKILVPMVVWSLFELTLILGVAAVINWTIDLATIAGIIASIGTGTHDQVMMIDEIMMGGADEKTYTLKQKIKKAFSIIFGAAATVVAAMLPLLFIGIGVMKGFAITTIIGIVIGIFITRPAFAKIAEKILERN